MPILTPSYFANYVQGPENFTAIQYSTVTMAWTVTANGANRVSINTSDPDMDALLINGAYSMFILTDGAVNVGDFTKNPLASGSAPRLDFIRNAGGQPVRFASLTQDGILNAWDIFEGTVPTGTDRMYLLGNPNCSIGADGLLTNSSLSEMDILVDAVKWKSERGTGILLDPESKMLARFPG
jgi:hypothetical protein